MNLSANKESRKFHLCESDDVYSLKKQTNCLLEVVIFQRKGPTMPDILTYMRI